MSVESIIDSLSSVKGPGELKEHELADVFLNRDW